MTSAVLMIIASLAASSFFFYVLWKRILLAEDARKTFPQDKEVSSREERGASAPSARPDGEGSKSIQAQEARIVNDVDLMLKALEHEQDPINRHLLYRDIVAHTFPKRHQDPRMRYLFLQTAEAHVHEIPGIIAALVHRFGSKPFFFTFSYYAIVLTEDMEFDRAIEVCRQAQELGVRDGLGIGFARRIEQIIAQKDRMSTSRAA